MPMHGAKLRWWFGMANAASLDRSNLISYRSSLSLTVVHHPLAHVDRTLAGMGEISVDASSEPDQPSAEAAAPESSDIRSDSAGHVAIKADTDFVVHGCQITRARLDRLWELARDGFSAQAYISIDYKKRGRVQSKLESKSIDELLSAITKSAINEDVDRLDNLRLYVSEGKRTIDIYLRGKWDFPDEGISVSVSGDEEWVHGRSSVLRDFLRGAQCALLTGRGYSRWAFVFIGFAGAVVVAIPSLNEYAQARPVTVPLYADLLILIGLIGLGYAIGSMIDRRKRSQLILSGARRQRVNRIDAVSLVVSVLVLIISVVAILVAHSDAIRGH
jgi:hypothetical protein